MDYGCHHPHHPDHNNTPTYNTHLPSSPTVRIFCKADETYCLSVRNGDVVLASSNPIDEQQHWVKDLRHSKRVKDEQGFPSFALINKATGEAIKHSIGADHPVRLVPYNPDDLDESVLWTESKDTGEGFRCIRMVNNISLNFDALYGDENYGVHDGTTIGLFEWIKGKNQRWKMQPWDVFPQGYNGRVGREVGTVTRVPTVRVFTMADESYSLCVRDGEVVLALANPCDEYQHWIKYMEYSTTIKDEEGLSSFALVNKVTGQAVKHSKGASHPVQLIPYNPGYLDKSVLWTESKDTGGGFRCIRMVNNICLNFDAFRGDEASGGVHDGTIVVLWEWLKLKGKNQRWKIVPYY